MIIKRSPKSTFEPYTISFTFESKEEEKIVKRFTLMSTTAVSSTKLSSTDMRFMLRMFDDIYTKLDK